MHTPNIEIIRSSSFTPQPWKNGGGTTHEAMRVPSSGDAFRWRLSVASIEASGPFSDFPAHNRKMVLLRGAGIDLRFGDGTRQTLRRVGDLAQFDGSVPAHCELLEGPCIDLNLMVLKSDRVLVRVERFVESLAVRAAEDETLLIFAIERGFALKVAGAAVESATLEPWDLAVLAHGSGRLERLEPADSSAPWVFLATLKLASGN